MSDTFDRLEAIVPQLATEHRPAVREALVEHRRQAAELAVLRDVHRKTFAALQHALSPEATQS